MAAPKYQNLTSQRKFQGTRKAMHAEENDIS